MLYGIRTIELWRLGSDGEKVQLKVVLTNEVIRAKCCNRAASSGPLTGQERGPGCTLRFVLSEQPKRCRLSFPSVRLVLRSRQSDMSSTTLPGNDGDGASGGMVLCLGEDNSESRHLSSLGNEGSSLESSLHEF